MTNISRTQIPGLNIQAPWSRLILMGLKTVETRSYPLPIKFIGEPLAIIETPGPKKIIPKAQIIGIVWFSGCFKYSSKDAWAADYHRHLVLPSDKQFGFNTKKPKYGWIVGRVQSIAIPSAAPEDRGIVFASKCSVDLIP